MAQLRVVLVHGAATTPAVWDRLVPLLRAAGLGGEQVVVPERPSSGDLATEIRSLAEVARSTVLVGVSGGATLGLALLASDVHLAGAVLHEPAVGTLCPGLLDPVIAGYKAGGVPGFGRALYGAGWTPDMAPPDPGAVARDLAMFAGFEPTEVAEGQGPVIVTVGSGSPPIRHEAARALNVRLGIEWTVLPRSDHFVHHDNPAALVNVVLDVVGRVPVGGWPSAPDLGPQSLSGPGVARLS